MICLICGTQSFTEPLSTHKYCWLALSNKLTMMFIKMSFTVKKLHSKLIQGSDVLLTKKQAIVMLYLAYA